VKTPNNRAPLNVAKKAGSAQLPKTTESAAGKPVAEITDAGIEEVDGLIRKMQSLPPEEQRIVRAMIQHSWEKAEEKESQPAGKYPVMCEQDVESLAFDLSVEQRRNLARKFERWALQLFASADLIEQLDAGTLQDDDEIVFPGATVQKILCNGRSHGLAVAAELEVLVSELRRCVGTKTHKPDAQTKLLVLSGN
jgi:hypothetical protein